MKSEALRKVLSLLVAFSLIFQQAGFAQGLAQLDISRYLGAFSGPEQFRPLQLRYFSYNPLTDNFQVLLDKGTLKKAEDSQIKEQGQELLKYFLVGVALPDENFWVNLRPDSEDEIISQELAETDVGKVLLEADLQLKKDVAKFTSPETPEGREYWNKLYRKAGELFNSSEITIPTLTRPWIVPGEVIIRENANSAYVYKGVLKVMLEQDHLNNSADYNFTDPRLKELNEYSSQLIRETIIPKLTKEVNSSKRYAQLRQVFFSLILSRWFKHKFAGQKGLIPKGTLPVYVNLINSGNLNGLTSQNTWSKTTYFEEYKKSFAQGEYNLKEQVNGVMGPVIRSYFSGGIDGRTLNPTGVFIGPSDAVSRVIRDGMVPLAKESSSPIEISTGVTINWPSRIESIMILGTELDRRRGSGGKAVKFLMHADVNQDKICYASKKEFIYMVNQLNFYGNPESQPLAKAFALGDMARVQSGILFAERFKSYSSQYEVKGSAGPQNTKGAVSLPVDNSKATEINKLREELNQLDINEYIALGNLAMDTREAIDNLKQTASANIHGKEGEVEKVGQTYDSLLMQLNREFTDKEKRLRESTGIQRVAIKEKIKTLEQPASSPVSVEAKVKSIVADQLGVDPEKVTPEASFVDDLGGDSMKPVEIVLALEDEFGIGIPDEDMGKITTLRTAVDYIKEKTGAASSPVGEENSLELAQYLKNLLDDLGKSEMVVNYDKLTLSFVMQGKRLKLDGGWQGAINNNPASEVSVSEIPGTRDIIVRINNPVSSSPVRSAPETTGEMPKAAGVGGIDFRVITMITQPMGNLSGLNFSLPHLSNLENINLNEELAQIQRMLQAGIIPSGERLKEYVAACYQKGELKEYLDGIVASVVDTCKLQEENVEVTSNALKEVMLILDSIS